MVGMAGSEDGGAGGQQPDRLGASLARLGIGRAGAGNTIWILVERMVRLLVGVVVGALVTRHLGPAGFGQMASALSFVALFQAVAGLQLDNLVVRDLARNPERAHRILGTTFLVRLAVGTGCWLAAIAAAAAIYPDDRTLVAAVAISGVLLAVQSTDAMDLWFQSRVQSRHAVAARLAASGLSQAIRVALVFAGAPLLAFVAIVAFEAIAGAAGLWLAYRAHRQPGRWWFSRGYARRLLRECWPYLLAGMAVAVYMRVDLLLIRGIAGEHEAGLYAAAVAVSQLWLMLPSALAASLAPRLSQLRHGDAAAFTLELTRAFRLFMVFGLCASLATSVAAPWLVGLLYGSRFEGTAPLLAIHAWTVLFISMGVAQGLWIVNEGAGRAGLAKTLTGMVVSLGGNLLLVPRFGATGAAAVAVAAQCASAVLANLVFAPGLLRLQLSACRFWKAGGG